MPASIYAKPARLSSSCYDEDDHLDENRPIPVTKDEEYDVAVRLIAASPQDHAVLSEAIAREFARRRLAGHAH